MTLVRPVGLGRTATVGLALPPLVFLGLFFAWPVVSILATGLAPEGRLAVDAIADALGRPYLLDTIVFTIGLAIAITAASFAVGLPAAWILARFTFPGRTALREPSPPPARHRWRKGLLHPVQAMATAP